MRGLLNPLLVRPFARPLVRPVRTPSALIRLSARPPIRPPFARPPLLCPTSACPPVRLPSTPHPPPSARPLVRRSPPVRPPSAPSTSSKNYLPFSSGPEFFTSCMPREIATSAIHGASRSHSGIRVSKFPPYVVNPRLTLLCRDREVRHDPSCRDVMTPS